MMRTKSEIEWEKTGYHYCSFCKKREKCKGEDCDFINLFGYHSSCYAKRELQKSKDRSCSL